MERRADRGISRSTHLLLLALRDAADGDGEAGGSRDLVYWQLVLDPLHPLGVRSVHLLRVTERTERLRPVVDSRPHVDLKITIAPDLLHTDQPGSCIGG